LSGVLVYISGGQRPPGAGIIAECKSNLSLPGVWFTFPAGSARWGTGIMAECKPNLSLSEVWFTFPAGSARRGLESWPNVNQICLCQGFGLHCRRAAPAGGWNHGRM